MNFPHKQFMGFGFATLTVLVASVVPAVAQSTDPARPFDEGRHKHDGFYLSMNIGPALGGTIINASGSNKPYSELIMRGGGSSGRPQDWRGDQGRPHSQF